MYLIEIIISLLSFSIGALIVWATAYSKEKGKNKGLKEDISDLENEKQKIQSKYQAELEELKKSHSLDVKKREFKYIDKREQFSKYFALLEEFHKKSNNAIADDFKPIMEDFLVSCIHEEITQDQALSKFSKSISSVFDDLNHDLLKLRTETHGIRLISSDILDGLLNELESTVDISVKTATEMIEVIGSREFFLDQSIIKPYEEKNIELGAKVTAIHKKVKDQMKKELDVI